MDNSFLSAALRHPTTKILIFRTLEPLVENPQKLAFATHNDVNSLIGDDPYSKSEADQMQEFDSSVFRPHLVFLGLDDRVEGISYKDHYKGAPFFALDVTPQQSLQEASEQLISQFEGRGHSFAQGRVMMSLPAQEAAIYAEARHMIDWNGRNPFCGQCGQRTTSTHGGWKRACPPTDLAQLPGDVSAGAKAPRERLPCATRGRISNLSFPRTDPTVIMATVSAKGDKVLLGRQKAWPAHTYSTLAGFLEPAESVEEAVRREVWEESGVLLGRVVIHSTQPWPYPANLMIGAIGQALPDGETINLGHDAELEDAKWFTLDEVRDALATRANGIGEPPGPGYKEGQLRLPPKTAIAHQLMQAVVNGGFLAGVTKI